MGINRINGMSLDTFLAHIDVLAPISYTYTWKKAYLLLAMGMQIGELTQKGWGVL
jgi:hypothetical protein